MPDVAKVQHHGIAWSAPLSTPRADALRSRAATLCNSLVVPRGAPTTTVTFRVDDDLLAWIDADAARQGKADRRAWFTDLAVAARTGQLIPRYPPRRPIRPKPKLTP